MKIYPFLGAATYIRMISGAGFIIPLWMLSHNCMYYKSLHELLNDFRQDGLPLNL